MDLNRWGKFKPASELTLFEAYNKLCFCDDLKIAHKMNETSSFASRKFYEYFLQIFDLFLWQVILNISFSLQLIY
jgi:hypothetical protein